MDVFPAGRVEGCSRRADHDAKQRRLIGRINNRSAQPGNGLLTTRALTDHLHLTAIAKEEGECDGRRSRFAYGGKRMLFVRGTMLPSQTSVRSAHVLLAAIASLAFSLSPGD
jgi:hypothetical protein